MDINNSDFELEIDLGTNKSILVSPYGQVKVMEITETINNRDYKFYLFDKSDQNFINSYREIARPDNYTFGIIFPNLKNAYNWRYLTRKVENKDYKFFYTDNYMEMYNYLVEDEIYNMFNNFLQIYTVPRGVKYEL